MAVNDITYSLSLVAADILAFLPRILGAIIILIIGWIVGRFVGGLVSRIMDRTGIDDALNRTFLGDVPQRMGLLPSREIFGTLVKWFIYLIFIMAAVAVLDIPLFTQLLHQFLLYIPVLISAILILIIGLVIINFVMNWIEHWLKSTGVAYTEILTTLLRAFLSLIIVMMALDQARIDTGIIYTFLVPLAWGLAVGIGLAIGIGVGWGSRDVITDYLRSAREKMK